MFVGEQPGDQEDRTGHPLVGPAGRRLDHALEEAGIDRSKVYVTNVVKHFKRGASGKRRIQKKPRGLEMQASRPWIAAEIRIVPPQVLVCLGATAAQALLGKNFRLNTQRGQFVDSELAPYATSTVHPSSILRAPDDAARQAQMTALVKDLKKIGKLLHSRQESLPNLVPNPRLSYGIRSRGWTTIGRLSLSVILARWTVYSSFGISELRVNTL